MYSPKIQKLIEIFSKFPTVGPRTAARFVFYLLKVPGEKAEELTEAIKELREKVKTCPLCFDSFEPEGKTKTELCPICSDPRRDKSQIMVVEKEVDLEAVEKIQKYKGLYFILGGTVPGLKKEEEEKKMEERASKLIERIKTGAKEVILALSPTVEGERTSLWLERRLKPLNIKITRLGRGLPAGGELEYADEETLLSALEGRK